MKLQFKVGDYANAAATAVQLDSLVTAKPDKAYAESWHGTALFYAAGDKPKPAKLEDAHAAFAAAISNGSREPVTFFYDGRTLALLHRDEEARADFQHYLDIAPANDRGRSRVAHFLADPDLARQKMAPPFTVVTDAGRTFNLDDMNGKVVLIDFWATWCGPCNEELPNVKKIAADFANDPFELISVSWDSNESAWRQFIAKNGMTWNQYRDADHKLSDAFAINSIPHYFTIDSDGVLRAEVLGSGNDVEGRLKKLVAKAREAAAASAAKAPSQPANLGN